MSKEQFKRHFDLGLKLRLVSQIDQGQLSVSEVSKIYGVSSTAVYKWLHKYSDIYQKQTRVIVEHKSISKKNQELRQRIAELEQALGHKQMRLEYLEQIIASASNRLGEDIEKKNKRLS